MKKLPKSLNAEIIVRPRWPYRYVHISDQAYDKLKRAQAMLKKDHITLVLTRGFEDEGLLRKTAHVGARCIGSIIFALLYPRRLGEIKKIFSANGHDVSGDCIDLSIVIGGQLLHLLPFGVFTTKTQITTIYNRHSHVIDGVWLALRDSGFTIHSNGTEAMQIHCEC